MSQLENSNIKIKVFEQQYILHSRSAQCFIDIFSTYKSLEIQRRNQIRQLLPKLDSIQTIFYKELASKLATYIDTCIFQIDHMVKDFDDNIKEYQKFRSLIESRFSSLMKEFKRKRSNTLDDLKKIYQPVSRNASQPSRQQMIKYNISLQHYEQANKELLTFRKQYQAKMMSQATDQLTKFFVLQLQQLRNNQFDIDQILKKSQKKQSQYKLMKINEQIFWQSIQIGPLELRISLQYQINKLNEIVHVLFQNKLPQTHDIFTLFNQQCVDAHIIKMPISLQNHQFQQILTSVLLSFRNHKILLKDYVFKKVYQIAKIISQFSIKNLHWQLLDSCITFCSAICTQRIISCDQQLQLCEVVCLIDYVKQLQCFSPDTWNTIYDNIIKKQQTKDIDNYRKIARRLGILTPQQKQKKRIFNNLEK